MAALKFRPLKASEIECRIAMVKENGISLLLYKDARVDQNILDETVGAYNWQRKHSRDNANCTVAIWDSEKNQWIEKEDTGKESYTEAEKGLASDSFKRACFNWGIGRELYTAPFIWIPNGAGCTIKNNKCYDKFEVGSIEIEDGTIKSLTIVNKGKQVFSFGNAPKAENKPSNDKGEEVQVDTKKIAKTKAQALTAKIEKKGLKPASITDYFKVKKVEDMNLEQFTKAMELLDRYPDKE